MAANRGDATLAERLASWAIELDHDRIPAATFEAVRRHLLDGIGCGVAAARTNAVPFAAALIEGTGPSTVLASGRRTTPGSAAFANGVLVHALDFDDTHAGALIHPTAVVLPALFAVAQETAATGAETLTAAVAGYEAVLRIGRAVRHGFHARGFHATSVCGVFAAALVTSRLRKLDASATVDALGIAGSMAAGSLEFLHTGSSTKQLHPGWASLAGVAAATLAAHGAGGPRTILDGGYGLFASYTGAAVEAESVVGGLGEEWESTRITIKPYPLCQLSHASLDAFAESLSEISATEDIERIEVEIPDESIPVVAEPRADKLSPRSPYEAKFSLPWDLAVLALDGEVSIDSFSEDRLDREDAAAVAGRVEVRGTPSPVPAASAPGLVKVTLTDGTVVERSVSSSRGGPERPLDDAALLDKFRANCGTGIREPGRLAEAILTLERQPSVDVVMDLAASDRVL